MNKTRKIKKRDILLEPRQDRRLLPNVPDESKRRTNIDRRGYKGIGEPSSKDIEEVKRINQLGTRYKVPYEVKLTYRENGRRKKILTQAVDISKTGILLEMDGMEDLERVRKAKDLKLDFKILAGTMPEGMEMGVKIGANIVRDQVAEDGRILCGLEFIENLEEYSYRKRGRPRLAIASLLLFIISSFIILMRAESLIYFRFNRSLYFYSIMAAFFLLSRYFFAIFYREVDIDMDYTPGVSIIIPCFNEEEWIQRTILGCMNQDYPVDRLEVIVVDDHSTDRSVEKIKDIVGQIYGEAADYRTRERLKCIFMDENGGKREALSKGILEARHELVVFVDSDSFLDPYAIRHLVQPFKDPKMGGVAGRTEVANTYSNALTKLQSVRYHIAFRVMKAAESIFDAVTCLSGPLACYRKEIVVDNIDNWLDQRFLGHQATFGDDRAMTNFVLKDYRTSYQDSAICYTIVPNRHRVFLKQQMRWKRSWLRESLMAGRYMWRKEPFGALTFYIGLIVPILAPLVVSYNLIYVPLVYKVFPTTFLVGLLMMALLLSAAQLFLRRSTTWAFGLLFALYYEGVLLWQMPIAWATFWKSTWGTRMTPNDVEARNRKRKKFSWFRGGSK